MNSPSESRFHPTIRIDSLCDLSYPQRATTVHPRMTQVRPLLADNEAGFTLVEMLVAVTLLGLISLTTYTALRFGTRTWDRSSTVIAQLDENRAVYSFLDRLISEVYPMRDNSDPTHPQIKFTGSRASLRFLAPIPQALGSGGFMWFTLSAREQNGVGALYIEWRPELAGDLGREPEVGGRKLLSGLKAVEMAYFGSIRPQEPPKWSDEWDRMVSLPQLVRVHAEFAGKDRRAWPDLVVQPRVTSDSSCIYDPVSRNCRGR